MAAPPCRHPSQYPPPPRRPCARRNGGVGSLPSCDCLEPRVLLSVVRAAAPFLPVPSDGPGRYQLVARGGVGVARDADVFSLGRLQPGDVLTVSLGGTAGGRGSLDDGLLELFRHDVDAAGAFRVAANDDDGPGADAFLYRYPVMTEDQYFVRV